MSHQSSDAEHRHGDSAEWWHEVLADYEAVLDRADVPPSEFLGSRSLLAEQVVDVRPRLERAYREFVFRNGPLHRSQQFGPSGKYVIVELIGRGGFSFVYRAQQFQTDSRNFSRDVALKILAPSHWDQDSTQRFLREQRHTTQVQHPNVVHVDEVGEYDGHLFLAMQYVAAGPDGERSLKEWLERNPEGAGCAPFAVDWLLGLARGIHALHARGICHRDIKPANVLLWTAESVRQPLLGDLGLARSPLDATVTKSLDVMGTPAYMAPEHGHGIHDDVRSDIFSFGVTAYEFLTGRLPYAVGTEGSPGRPVRPPELPSHRVRDFDRGLEAAVLRCLSWRLTDRYDTMGDVIRELELLKQHRPPERVRLLSGWRRVVYQARRSRWLRPALNSGWALIVIGAAAFAIQSLGWRERNGIDDQTASVASSSPVVEPFTISMQQKLLDRIRQALEDGQFSDAQAALSQMPIDRRDWAWGYLRSRIGERQICEQAASVHDWGTSCAAVSGDGRAVVTFGQDGRAVRTDLETLESRDLMAGNWDSERRRWRHFLLESPSAEAQNSLDCVRSVCRLKDDGWLACVSHSGRAQLLKVSADELSVERELLTGHDHPLTSIAVAPDDQSFLLGDAAGALFHCDRCGSVSSVAWTHSDSPVMDVIWLNSETCAVAQADGLLSLVSLSSGRTLAQQQFPGRVWDLELAPDGVTLAIASQSPKLVTLRWNRENNGLDPGSQYRAPGTDQDPLVALHAIRFSPSGQQLVAGDNLGRLLWWQMGHSDPTTSGGFETEDWGQAVTRALPVGLLRRYVGFEFIEQEQVVVSWGRQGVLKLWRLKPEQVHQQFTGPKNPLLCAVTGQPDWLWIAGDRELGLWNVNRAERVAVCDLGQTVTALAADAVGQTLATGNDQGTIRFWQRSGEKVHPDDRKPVENGQSIRALAISPDGQRLAAVDDAGLLRQWLLRAQGEVIEAGELTVGVALRSRLAYSSDGQVLACIAPDSDVLLLKSDSLTVTGHPQLAAGRGATCLWWPRGAPMSLVAGDSEGSLRRHDLAPLPAGNFQRGGLPSAVAGLADSSLGDLFFAVAEEGFVRCVELKTGHTLLTLQLPRRASPVCSVACDDSGRHLALAHADGTIDVLSASVPTTTPERSNESRWDSQVLTEWPHSQEIAIRSRSVQTLGNGHVAVLYSIVPQVSETEPPQEHIQLGLWTSHGNSFQTRRMATIDLRGLRNTDGEKRSLCLLETTDGIWTAYRHPVPERGAYVGEIRVQCWHLDERGRLVEREQTRSADVPRGNFGFDLQLTASTTRVPTAWHFSHAGHELLCSRWQDPGWTTAPVGRSGDGIAMFGTADAAGRFHAMFRPNRINSEVSPPVYLRIDPATGDELRETIRHWAMYSCDDLAMLEGSFVRPQESVIDAQSSTATDRAVPTALYTRELTQTLWELGLASRCEGQWQTRKLFDFDSFHPLRLSNMVQVAPQRLGVALLSFKSGRLDWLTISPTTVTVETVADFSNDGVPPLFAQLAATVIDSQRVIVMADSRATQSYLRLFRAPSP